MLLTIQSAQRMQMATLFTASTFIFSKANGIIYILYLVDFLTNELDLRDDCFPPNNLGKQLSLF